MEDLNTGVNPDFILVHTPKFQTYYPPLNVYQSCNRMALGLLALADLADRHGFATRVLHLGIERIRDRNFSFNSWLAEHRPQVIGFSLHFHHGLVDTLKMVQEARRALPEAFIFLGGFTATFFQEEILNYCPEVDAVVAGDAEQPILKILDQVLGIGGRDFSGVPNLRWRKHGETISQPQSYVIDETTLNQLNFTNFDLFEHGADYVNMPSAHLTTKLPGFLEGALQQKLGADRQGIYWGLPVGRGCVTNCFYCGGGAKAQLQINQRKGVIFRQPERVIDSIRHLQERGFTSSYVSFDPHPWSETYYVKLFRMMHEQGIRFNLIFSAWGLPSDTFLDAFAECLGPESKYYISPETGSDRLRKSLRTGAYDNATFLDRLAAADQRGISTTTFFCIGVPGEGPAEFAETIALKEQLTSRFERASAEAFLIEIEPGAPWLLDPDRYGIRLLRRTFDDFLRDHAAADYSSMTSLGYTSAFFGDPEISAKEFSQKLLQLRCRHFCDKRLSCAAMRIFWGACSGLGLAPLARQRGNVQT